MPPQNLSLIHLIRPPQGEPAAKPPLLLLLHGVGSHERDLFELAPYFDERFFIVSARAPLTLGYESFAWFHVQFTSTGPVINPAEAESSRQTLLHFLTELVEAYRVDPQRIYLCGFSQGAIMSFSLALTQPQRVAGIVAMSGRILPEVLPLLAPPADLTHLPIMVVHGLYDNVLPIQYGRASQQRLSELPVNLTYREYPMGHQISAESLADIQQWLADQLDRTW
ncbi:MAG: alpha/beta fold hydrolase [Anaerolineae bacterium]